MIWKMSASTDTHTEWIHSSEDDQNVLAFHPKMEIFHPKLSGWKGWKGVLKLSEKSIKDIKECKYFP